MPDEALLKQIEAAKLVLTEAEDELRTVVERDAAPENVETSRAARAASLRLEAAEAQLNALEKLLVRGNLEEAKMRVETARTAVIDADKNLETVLGDAPVLAPDQERWVTDVVAAAFTKLKTAKAELLALETSVATKKA